MNQAIDKDKNKDTILKYQNIACISVSVIALLNTLWTNAHNTFHNFSVPFILVYFIVDLRFASTWEMRIHHILGLAGIAFKLIYNVQPEYDWSFTRALYKTEISSFFLVFKYVLSEKTKQNPDSKLWSRLTHANNAIFFVTFFKYRILDYGRDVILNPENYALLEDYTQNSWFRHAFLNLSFYGLYALNLYWFTIMCKVLFKQTIRKWINLKTAFITERKVTSFTYFIAIVTSVGIYSKSPNESYLYDFVGVGVMSLASYNYHSSVVQYYKAHGKLKYTSYDILGAFVLDQFAIHLRSFLCSVSALYYSEHREYVFITASAHIGTLIAFTRYIYNLKRDRCDIVYDPADEKATRFVSICNAMTILPSMVDCVIIVSNSSTRLAAVQMVFAAYFCGLVIYLNPLYEFNHIAFHVGIILHAIGLSRCNLR